MSFLTENILRGADDDFIRKRRKENFDHLARAFHHQNGLTLRVPEGAFAYPLLVPQGAEVRRRLIEDHVYIPTLWPNVVNDAREGAWEQTLAQDILPLPVDQRYNADDMAWLIEEVEKWLR